MRLIAQELCPSLLLILYETASLQVILCTGLVGNLVVNEQLAITNLPHDWWTGQWILFSSFFSSNYFLWQSKKSSIYRCVCSELPDSGKLQLFGRRLLFSLWGKFAGVTTARLLSDKRSLYPHNIYIITMLSLSKVLLSILPLLSKLSLFARSSQGFCLINDPFTLMISTLSLYYRYLKFHCQYYQFN